MSQKKHAESMKDMPSGHGSEMNQSTDARATMLFDNNFETFANHLSMISPQIREIVKFPPWLLFPLTYQRRDQAKLRTRINNGFSAHLTCSTRTVLLGQFVDVHGQPPTRCITLVFCLGIGSSWSNFEQALRSIHPDVAIPYWDSSNSEQGIPAWLAECHTHCRDTDTNNQCPSSGRYPADLAKLIFCRQYSKCVETKRIPTFTGTLEAIHDGVHVWVGGSMGAIPTAPADPIFWMPRPTSTVSGLCGRRARKAPARIPA